MIHALWFILPGIFAAALAYLFTPFAARLAVLVGAVDMPGERKVHTTPIPRLGGLAVVASIAITVAAAPFLTSGRWKLPRELMLPMAAGVLPILLISIVDDIRGVAARWKLAAHALGALIAVTLGITLAPVVHLFGSPIHIGWFAAPLSVAWIVGVTNAFNLIDGLDGLSTGLAFISAICMAAVFAIVGQPGMAVVSLVLGGALAGFLPFNVHPARLFLGDTGATAIGFCLAAFALRGGSTLSTGFAALLPVFILGLPIADTLIAMVRRTMNRGERRQGGVFQPDRDHIHHRLLALGIDHGRAVLVLYGAGLVLAGAALVSVFVTTREAAMMVMALLLAGIVGIQRLGYDEFAFIRRGTVLRVYEIPAVKRGFFVVLVDIALSFVAAYLSVGLKTDEWILSSVGGFVLELATTLAPITIAVFAWRGMYKGTWRVAGIQDFTKAALAVWIATPLAAIVLRSFGAERYPLSLFAIYGVITLLLTVALRSSYVILENWKLRASHRGTPILVYGAGRRGATAVHELFRSAGAGLLPVGFVDDDLTKVGRIVNGVPVLGPGRDIERLLRSSGAKGILLSTPRIALERLDASTAICEALSVAMFRLDLSVRRLDGQEFLDPVFQAIGPTALAESPSTSEGDAHGAGQKCPSCLKPAAHRSKARTAFERFRKARTQRRLYRCEKCGWRGWLTPLDFNAPSAVPDGRTPDFGTLDGVVRPGTGGRPSSVALDALDFK
jgi:UDP-GlcNAc:undecaprenyl-phosphate GlcNAc-1-phosphate transferase